MARGPIAGVCAALMAGIAAGAAAQPTTPGQIADPSTYAGSMELQRQEHERDQQTQQQNDQMLQRLNQNYAHPPGVGGGGRAGPAPINWRARPPLPPAKNPLLGRWRQVAARGVTGRQLTGGQGGLLPGSGDVAASLYNGIMAGGCKSIFGGGVVAFEPHALQWVAPDGHEEILNHVEYRADGPNVVMLSNDPGALPWLIFGFPGHDNAVVAALNCTMVRVTAGGAVAAGPRSPAPGAQLATARPATAQSITARSGLPGRLSVQTGASAPGSFAPLAGAVLYVVTRDPDAALVAAGFAGASPIDAWFAACHTDQERCKAGIRAMTAGAVGNTRTDVNGNGEVPQLPAGRYYIVGHVGFGGKELVWHKPIAVQPGENRVVLDQTNGSVG